MRSSPSPRTLSLSLLLPLLALSGCPRSSSTPDAAAEAGATDASPGGGDGGAGGDGGDDDEVKPVYPLDPGVAPNPLAARLCVGMMENQEKRRATCCKHPPGILLTSECTRMLSAALAAKALALSEASVDRCLGALAKTYEGCDWVGPFPPETPAECHGLFEGKLPKGTRCRSSLECEGELRCHGIGPTTTGKCGEGKPDGESCGGSTDPLAGYTRQSRLDVTHRECKSQCIQHRCGVPKADGTPCSTSAECKPGSQCLAKKCTVSPPAKLGAPCPGGVCEGTAECILGKCAQRKAAGEACTADFECIAGCLRPDGGTRGKCGMRCDIR